MGLKAITGWYCKERNPDVWDYVMWSAIVAGGWWCATRVLTEMMLYIVERRLRK